ncbi:MAG: TolC family protein [bacterium]|nr:TolC family protein [bacterium]
MVKILSLWVLLCMLALMPSGVRAVEQLSLSDAISIALTKNPEVIRANREIDASRGRFWQGISLPPTTVSVAYENVPVGEKAKHYRERVVEIEQSFDFPTTYGLRGKSLAAETKVANASFTNVQQTIIQQVKIAYYTAVALRSKMELAEENRKIAEDFSRKADSRFTHGESTRLEKLTATVQYTQAQNDVVIARNRFQMAMGDLLYSLGRDRYDVSTSIVLTDSLVYQPHFAKMDSLFQSARQSNPELRANSFRVKSAAMNRALAWSSLLPSLSLGYNRVTTSNEESSYGVIFGMSVPLWFMFDQRGQIQEATANLRKTESDLTTVENLVRLEVQNAFLELNTQEQQVLLYQSDLLPQAKEVYRVASSSFETGEISYIEYLQAKQSLIAMESEYIDALLSVKSAMAKLEKAVGKELHP